MLYEDQRVLDILWSLSRNGHGPGAPFWWTGRLGHALTADHKGLVTLMASGNEAVSRLAAQCLRGEVVPSLVHFIEDDYFSVSDGQDFDNLVDAIGDVRRVVVEGDEDRYEKLLDAMEAALKLSFCNVLERVEELEGVIEEKNDRITELEGELEELQPEEKEVQ